MRRARPVLVPFRTPTGEVAILDWSWGVPRWAFVRRLRGRRLYRRVRAERPDFPDRPR